MTNSSWVLFFCMWLSNFLKSTIYWRGFLFSIVCFWLLCQRLFAHIHVGLFLGSQSCSMVWVPVFRLKPCCLDYCHFVLQFKVRELLNHLQILGRVYQWSHLVLGLYFWGSFLMIVSLFSLLNGLFGLSSYSWFNLGRLYISKNLSIFF